MFNMFEVSEKLKIDMFNMFEISKKSEMFAMYRMLAMLGIMIMIKEFACGYVNVNLNAM